MGIFRKLTADPVQGTVFTNRDLRVLLVPLVIEQALALLVGMVDTVMVSGAGEAAISGVSLVDMINVLLFNLLAAFATGGAVVVSQALGAKDHRRAEMRASRMLGLCLIAGVGLMVLCMLLRGQIISLFFGSITQEVRAACLLYFVITLISYPFLAVYNAGSALFRSLGNSAVSMKTSVLMNLINVVGNAFCIYHLHMGVAGVAVPTLISRVVGAGVIIVLMVSRKNPLRIHAKDMFFGHPNATKHILYIGIPSAVENSIFQLGRIIVVSMIATFGTVQITANAVANNWDGIGCIVGNAFSFAMVTVIGRCVGTGDLGQVRHYAKKLTRWDGLLQGAGNVLIILILPFILRLYSMSAEAAALSWKLIMIHEVCAIFMWPLAFVFPNMLRSANDVRFTMIASIASMFVFRVGLSYVLCVRMGMGAVGVWIAMVIDWVCRITCFVSRYLSGKWEAYARGHR